MAERTEALDKAMKDRDLSDKERDQVRAQQRETEWVNYQLEQLAKSNSAYQDPAKREALLTYTREILQRRDLTAVHKAMNYDTDVKAADETGYQRGLKEGNKSAPVPSIPHGTRVVPTAAPPEKLPATFAEFSDGASNDQALIAEIREAASTPPPGG